MAADDETTAADDELARRRQERMEEEPGKSVEQIAGEPEDEASLFPLGTLEGDPKKTVKNLMRAGVPVKVAVSMTRAAVPNPGGGLFDPEEETAVLVRVLPGPVVQAPVHETRDGLHRVKEWHVGQELRVIHVQRADNLYTVEQVAELMEAGGVPS